jgi:WD40 repeat protein
MRFIRILRTLLIYQLFLYGCMMDQKISDTDRQPETPSNITLTAMPAATTTPNLAASPTPTMTENQTAATTPTSTPSGFLGEHPVGRSHEIAWSLDGSKLAVLHEKGISILDPLDFSITWTSELDWEPVNVNFNSDGTLVAACERLLNQDGDQVLTHFAVWETKDGQVEAKETLEIPTCPSLFINSQDLIFYKFEDWRWEPGDKEIYVWRVGSGLISSIKYARIMFRDQLLDTSSDGKMAVHWVEHMQPGMEPEWYLYLMRAGQQYPSITFPSTERVNAFISPDNRYLILSDIEECTIHFFNLSLKAVEFQLSWCQIDEYSDLDIVSIIVDSESELMVVAFNGGKVTIWNLHSKSIVKEIMLPQSAIVDIAINSDKQELAVLTNRGGNSYLSFWDLQSY